MVHVNLLRVKDRVRSDALSSNHYSPFHERVTPNGTRKRVASNSSRPALAVRIAIQASVQASCIPIPHPLTRYLYHTRIYSPLACSKYAPCRSEPTIHPIHSSSRSVTIRHLTLALSPNRDSMKHTFRSQNQQRSRTGYSLASALSLEIRALSPHFSRGPILLLLL